MGVVNVGELGLERARKAPPYRALDFWLGMNAEDVSISVSERRQPGVDASGQPRTLLPGFLVKGILFQRADVDLQRLRRIKKLILEQFGETVVSRHPLCRALGVSELRFVHTRELFPFAGRSIQGFKDATDFNLFGAPRKESLERLQRGPVPGRGLDTIVIRAQSAVYISKLGL